MLVNSDDFDIELAQQAVQSLQLVLAARTHKKKYLGKDYVLPGQLGKALKLPQIHSRLNSPMSNRRQQGLDDFKFLWDTLSENTRHIVAEDLGWYEPERLEWDDKRSNRKPAP